MTEHMQADYRALIPALAADAIDTTPEPSYSVRLPIDPVVGCKDIGTL
jgi:hypothetical protein